MTNERTRVADLTIGPIEARIEASDVEAYRRATTLGALPPTDGRVPATFPAIWLWHPKAAAAVAEATRDGSKVPVLVAQRFEYHRIMAIGETYRFSIRRFAEPGDAEAIAIEARVHATDGALAATFSATYRMFALATTGGT